MEHKTTDGKTYSRIEDALAHESYLDSIEEDERITIDYTKELITDLLRAVNLLKTDCVVKSNILNCEVCTCKDSCKTLEVFNRGLEYIG